PNARPRPLWRPGGNVGYAATQTIAVGIDCVSTNPLPRKGRMISGVGALLAASTVLAARPRATDSQVRAKANRIRMPAAASQFAALVVARNPVSSATAATATMPSTVWITPRPTPPVDMLPP